MSMSTLFFFHLPHTCIYHEIMKCMITGARICITSYRTLHSFCFIKYKNIAFQEFVVLLVLTSTWPLKPNLQSSLKNWAYTARIEKNVSK